MTKVVSGNKSVTTAGTQVQLVSVDTPVLSVKVHALSGNSGVIYVGDENVSSTTGVPLAAGSSEEIIFVRKEGDLPGNLKDVWVDAATNGDGVAFLAVAVR